MCKLIELQIAEGISAVKGYLINDLKFYLRKKVEEMKKAAEEKAENQKD